MFYNDWEECNRLGFDDKCFLKTFLEGQEESTKPLLYSDEETIDGIVRFLLELDANRIIEYLSESCEVGDIDPAVIPQYSNFNDGTEVLCNVLSHQNGLSYNEIGNIINVTSPTDMARKKYGENHSKISKICSLVYFKRDGEYKVYLSSLGKHFNKLNGNEKRKICQLMLLRNNLYKKLIFLAVNGLEINMREMLRNLSDSTYKRRKPNIIAVLRLILFDTNYYDLMKKIND